MHDLQQGGSYVYSFSFYIKKKKLIRFFFFLKVSGAAESSSVSSHQQLISQPSTKVIINVAQQKHKL